MPLYETGSTSNESFREIWKFFYRVYDRKRFNFCLHVMKLKEGMKDILFFTSIYLLLSKRISYAFRNNIQSQKSHLKQSKHKTSFHLSKQSKTQFTYYANLCYFGWKPCIGCSPPIASTILHESYECMTASISTFWSVLKRIRNK